MVSIALAQDNAQNTLRSGLSEHDGARVLDALAFVEPIYKGKTISAGQYSFESGQDVFAFSLGVATVLAQLETDADTRIAALLFELDAIDPLAAEKIEQRFGKEVGNLVRGVRQLMRLHKEAFARQEAGRGKNAAQEAAAQLEILRKMLLAMAPDMRVVLVRLGSRVTTLRYFSEQRMFTEQARQYARETFDLYAPLANRLGVWQLKWELEDLSFRFLEPEAYKRIASQLEEKRTEREAFVAQAITRLNAEMAAAGIKAEVFGRPKHIYSIWSKLRGKELAFSDLYDVRAFRVIVDDVKTCYSVLGIVHNIWTPLPEEFDDYIARPKANGYQSLHTIVIAEDGRPLEVQIRTADMHDFAEYGVAAHWRYKEAGNSNFSAQRKDDEKIAWLRQLLAWKSEVVDTVVAQEDVHRDWVEKLKSTTFDDRIYVLTPQGRVIELPNGATPIDFAYHLHSDVGHRCRGARVNGALVPLNTVLKNGQTVEIITAKGASAMTGAVGPSRDWLAPGYAASARTRAKVRAWFNAIKQQETLTQGRSLIEKTLQREGKTAVNLEELAHKLGFSKLDDFLLAVGKDEFSLRTVEQALHGGEAEQAEPENAVIARKSRASSVAQGAKSGVLVVGTDGLMTQLAKCCKPAPPDPIVGFVTRGKGVSIHRANCRNFVEMRKRAPERVIQTEWGGADIASVYPVDIFVLAGDRQGLLRDISDIFLREKINVVGVSTQSAKGHARMAFTAEIASTAQLQKALAVIREVNGVLDARRH
jgi:GTP pyrophosphokinase